MNGISMYVTNHNDNNTCAHFNEETTSSTYLRGTSLEAESILNSPFLNSCLCQDGFSCQEICGE